MMKLENYLNDGANWQAVCVMAYLRSRCLGDYINSELSEYKDKIGEGEYAWIISVGRFENCREQGYIVSFMNRKMFQQINYCFYEHRNSDSICVVRFDCGVTINTPTNEMVFAVMKDKWDTTKDFHYGEIMECGNWIMDDVCKEFEKLCKKDCEVE